MNVIFGGYRFHLTDSYTTRWDSTGHWERADISVAQSSVTATIVIRREIVIECGDGESDHQILPRPLGDRW